MISHFCRFLVERGCFHRLGLGVVLAVSLWAHAPAFALSVVPRSFDELVQRADLVMVGTVQDVRSEFADGGLDQNTIFSYVSFGDLDVVKGRVAAMEYELRVPGGVVGRFAQDYPGVPTFQTGQRYLLFIRGNRRDFFPVVGITQGVYRVLTTTQERHVVVRDDQIDRTGRRALTSAAQNAPSLDTFIQAIRSRLTPAPGNLQP